MSCLVGIVQNKKAYIGSELRATSSDGSIHYFKCEKIFKNGNYVIGYCGSVRSGQVLKAEYFTPPKSLKDLPDAIRAKHEETGCLGKSDTSMDITESNYLVIHKNKLYTILADYQMHEVDDYYCIGSGSPYAFGSLATTSSDLVELTPEQRIELALQAAHKFDGACGPPPFQIISSN